ncbi:MAG: amidohydrolase family protein [Deltaproteobacteria bacterium]|nr:amidohydrolase family protein [Deltaproteobacteria bacterium]MBW2359287.1 amidohydrolase family protein [Deltaproteobacteria bacterium]
MLDVVIRGGTLVDGSGDASRRGDLGIRDGRIVAIGTVDEEAREQIDARGKVVAPGFVDVHTHYDAQVFWDGTLSPSPFHGVTTVMAGNCGFSLAPLSPEAGDYLMRMLARVEGMPLESLQAGVPCDWRSFGEYLDKLEGKLSVNAAFMVGHSALRRVVMGERAVGEEATPAELAEMVELLRTSMAEGGMGFSSTISKTHNDADGRPVPSRHASKEEILTLARQVRDFPGTTVEFLPGVGWGQAAKEYMAEISLAANRPLNWNLIAPTAEGADLVEGQLDATDVARARGAEVIALTVPQPISVRINLHSGFVFDALPGWAGLFQMPVEERKTFLEDPANRAKLDADARSEDPGFFRGLADWENMIVDQVRKPDLHKYRGRRVGEIAAELGKQPFDAMLDIALEDGLHTYFMPPSLGHDEESWKLRGKVWQDDRTVIGASDAGAHLDMIDTFAFTSQVLENGVRKFGVISLEEAVRQLSDVPARLFGLRERGRLEVGWHADVVVFDPATVGLGETYTKVDLPAGAGRLYADAKGVEHVFANGVEIVRGNEDTGARPGTILRSGRDTDTVEVPGGANA